MKRIKHGTKFIISINFILVILGWGEKKKKITGHTQGCEFSSLTTGKVLRGDKLRESKKILGEHTQKHHTDI